MATTTPAEALFDALDAIDADHDDPATCHPNWVARAVGFDGATTVEGGYTSVWACPECLAPKLEALGKFYAHTKVEQKNSETL